MHFGVSNKLPTYSSQFRHVNSSIQDNVEQKSSRKTNKDINLRRIEMPRKQRHRDSQPLRGERAGIMREGSLEHTMLSLQAL